MSEKHRLPFPGMRRETKLYKIGIMCVLCGIAGAFYQVPGKLFSKGVAPEGYTCKPPLPTLLAHSPPKHDVPQLQRASASLDEYLSERTSQPDIDSLTIAIVTPAGTVFERGYGVLRANETDPTKKGSVDSNSIYRIASITKMFTVLETLILRERGALNWDDPVSKFLPNFTYPSYGWAEYLSGTGVDGRGQKQPPITLRQLASHMSGVGRDYPPLKLGAWPGPFPSGLKKFKDPAGFPNRSVEGLLRSVATYPLVAPQYTYPIYSNSGMDLLGLLNIAANQLANGDKDSQPQAHKELVKRDIFDKIGLSSSFYRVPSVTALADRIAIPSSNSEWADYAFDDSDDPAGGQYSSLADLTTLMKTLLSPTAEGGVISDYVVREWLRPLHPWSDSFQEVGAPWEIFKVPGGETRLYSKGGNLPGYHTEFSINPQASYGVIVLVTGNYSNTISLVTEALLRFQPAFESILALHAVHAYGGVWYGENSVAVVTMEDGSLYVKKLVIRGSDVLSLVQDVPRRKAKPVALWSTGRLGEFRLAFGRPELNDDPRAGCEPYWITIDPGLSSRGAPIDLLYFEDGKLIYPSAGVQLVRD